MVPGPEQARPQHGMDPEPLKGPVKRFDDAWRRGPRPDLDDYLPADDKLRHPLLIELVHVDLELRLKAGEAARAEDYLTRYPELAGDRAAALELIVAEHDFRRRGEPALTLDDYLRRFPQYRAELAGLLAEATIADRERPRRPDPYPAAAIVVPGYELLGPLGRGGMGVVYKARQLSLNRLVALKFLPEECARDPVWLERFRREARIASALNHPHICTIYDTGEHAGRPFLSMELIEGRTLEVGAGERPPLEQSVRWLGQAARALAAAHAAGVVHRDVKPANLMVRADGIVKVLDFGLARRLPAGLAAGAAPGGRETDPGTRVGTVWYMAPEQARAEAISTATDVFALGIVLYELTTGQHPFAADLEGGVLHAIATQPPLPPERLNPEIPTALADLIQRMLEKDPERRPTALAAEAALADLATGGPARPAAVPAAAPRRPVVGRQHERAALHAGFASADAGRGLLLCVTGDAGLGKTTLVEDFLAELADGGRPCAVARGRCSERLAGAEAYLPFLEALDDLLRGADGAAAARAMQQLAPTWYAQLAPAANPVLAEGREASQERLKRELAVLLEEVARPRPLVLFLDDVHWADPSSVDLLAYLGGRCAGRRWLLLVAYRPADLLLGQHAFAPLKLDLQGRGVCRELALPLLSRADLDGYLAAAFAGHRFPEEFTALIHARTGGNPLFMVDLLRYLRDRGALVQDGGGWTLVHAVPALLRELPESVRGMIERKVRQLDSPDLHLLMAGSIQGREFDSAVVARVLAWEAAEVEERLDVLERVHGLVQLVREQEFPDGTLTLRYRFVHGLYQNALYGCVLPTRKAAWSAAAALALLGHYGEKTEAVAAELALLFEAARDPVRAVDHCLLAARHAIRVSAHQEAAALARRGLELLPRVPEAPARDRQERALLIVLGVSLIATRGFAAAEVEQTYQRMRALCQRGEDVPALFAAVYGLWNVYLVRCELSRCRELAAQMFAFARGQTDPVFRLLAHNVLQQPLFHAGELTAARAHQAEGLALYDAHKHRTLTAFYGEDPGVGCLAYRAVTLWHLGYPEQALRAALAARALAAELASPFNAAQALYFAACTHLCRREVARAGELAEALLDLCRDQGFALLAAGGLILQGWSLSEQGRRDEGIRQLQQGLADWQATGALSHRPFHLALLAEALGKAGRADEALAALDEGLTLCGKTGEHFWEAELHRLRGEMTLLCADAVTLAREAENCFREALGVAVGQGAKSLELRAALSLGRLLREHGRQHEGHSLMADVLGWFTEGQDTVDLQEARAFCEAGA